MVKMKCQSCEKEFVCNANRAILKGTQCEYYKHPFEHCYCKECSIKKNLSTEKQNILCYSETQVFIFR
jgi:hypothetical protein